MMRQETGDDGGEDGVSDDGQEWESEEVDRLNGGTSSYSLRVKESAVGVCVCVCVCVCFFCASFEAVRSCHSDDR